MAVWCEVEQCPYQRGYRCTRQGLKINPNGTCGYVYVRAGDGTFIPVQGRLEAAVSADCMNDVKIIDANVNEGK